MEYFDLKVGSTLEVITSVSNDSLVVQDVLSEKVPNFMMNCSMFLGSYAIRVAAHHPQVHVWPHPHRPHALDLGAVHLPRRHC